MGWTDLIDVVIAIASFAPIDRILALHGERAGDAQV